MPRPQTIIVATDYSENATRAVRQAAHLARSWGATLTLVHVFNDSAWGSLMAVYDLPGWATVKPIEAAKRRLEQLRGQIANEFSLQTDVALLTGRASQLIGELAVARQAGLVVVGEHGENWVKDIVLGGTALKVVETTRIPVLLVRRAEPGLYRSIVIATDFSVTAERAANLALDCFPAARHALIHAWLVPFEANMRMGGADEADIERYRKRKFSAATEELETLAGSLAGKVQGADLERQALHGHPAAVVFDQVRARSADLIVIGKHGGQYVDERLLGSVTQNVLYHADCDVLLSA